MDVDLAVDLGGARPDRGGGVTDHAAVPDGQPRVGIEVEVRPAQLLDRVGQLVVDVADLVDVAGGDQSEKRCSVSRAGPAYVDVHARTVPGGASGGNCLSDGRFPGDNAGMSQTPQEHVVVVGPDGSPMLATPDVEPGENHSETPPMELVQQPAKVMRIGTMTKQLLEEVRAAPLDEASRARLREIHARSIAELEDGLAPELREELERLTLPFADEGVPSEAELRIAQAQLVGWLEGLFHGIQTALFAQQMAARAQLEEMRRRALPPGASADGGPDAPRPGFSGSSGPYL